MKYIKSLPVRVSDTDKHISFENLNTYLGSITTMLSFIFFLIFQVVLLAAWVSGYLDPYQKQLQEILLDYMGENKVSYGLKSTLQSQQYWKRFPWLSILTYTSEPNRQETYRGPESKQDSRPAGKPTSWSVWKGWFGRRGWFCIEQEPLNLVSDWMSE
jgi:hypothetical protein